MPTKDQAFQTLIHWAGSEWLALWDWWIAVGLWMVTGIVALAYWVRVSLYGKARAERISKQGGSKLLSEDVMQGAYWFFESLGRIAVFFRLTPAQLTWSAFFFGLVSALCFGFGHFGSGALFGILSMILDALDGMVARLTHSVTEGGKILDSSLDRYVEFAVFFGILFRYREIPWVFALAGAALLGSFMVSYSTAKAEAMHLEAPRGMMRRHERAVVLFIGAALSPVTIPLWERYREYPVAIAHPMVFALAVLAVLANFSAVDRLIQITRNAARRQSQLQNLQSSAKSSAAPVSLSIAPTQACETPGGRTHR